ncbi:MAG TPA: type IV toxin-antitoxin system AbiEi family antitoxin domain-containing protein [Solirubrobacteraceae bacterium]|nr:type IV toxin-antitoxin system AbiEi family antitoxin domain-containing protein [Solirubrobacteraceae bacterium]
MPTTRFNELAELAGEQFGLVTLADARTVGYAPEYMSRLVARGQLQRVSSGVYRVPFLAGGELAPYMAAALWPQRARGVLSHETALDLWDVSDVNPDKIHVTVPAAHRPQRAVPAAYAIHREDLAPDDVTAIEGVPVVRLATAIRQCASEHLGADLLDQALRHGRARGLLSAEQARRLRRELSLKQTEQARA